MPLDAIHRKTLEKIKAGKVVNANQAIAAFNAASFRTEIDRTGQCEILVLQLANIPAKRILLNTPNQSLSGLRPPGAEAEDSFERSQKPLMTRPSDSDIMHAAELALSLNPA